MRRGLVADGERRTQTAPRRRRGANQPPGASTWAACLITSPSCSGTLISLVDPSQSLMEFRLPKYDMKEDFSFDLVAGLAVAAMLVPQVASILCIHTHPLPAVSCVRYSRRLASNSRSLHRVGPSLTLPLPARSSTSAGPPTRLRGSRHEQTAQRRSRRTLFDLGEPPLCPVPRLADLAPVGRSQSGRLSPLWQRHRRRRDSQSQSLRYGTRVGIVGMLQVFCGCRGSRTDLSSRVACFYSPWASSVWASSTTCLHARCCVVSSTPWPL